MNPPLKPTIFILLIIFFIYTCTKAESLKLEYDLKLRDEEKADYNVFQRWLWQCIASGITHELKYILFQFFFSDLIDKFFKNALLTVLFRKWVQRNKLESFDQIKIRKQFESTCAQNGMFQTYLHKGVKGMIKLVEMPLLFFLPRFMNFYFLTTRMGKNVDRATYSVYIFLLFAILGFSILSMVIETHYRKKFTVAKAQIDNLTSECIANHELITCFHAESKEFKLLKEKIRKYKRSFIAFKIVKYILNIHVYLISDGIIAYLAYSLNSRHSKYPKSLMDVVLQSVEIIEKNAMWAGNFLVNIKRSTCDASFAYDFVNFVDKFDTAEFNEETSSRKNFLSEYNDENKENETQLNMQYDTFSHENSYLSDFANFSYLKDQSNLIMEFVDFVVYAGSTPLFKPLNLKISKNQKILIKGSNGIGKSSIIRALFHKMPYTGKIIVKEQDTKTISALELKNEISICPQMVNLFNRTIRYNLNYGSETEDDQINEICEKLLLKEKLESLEMGLDTVLLPYGENLSGGERKKMCIARTLLKKAQIYWFDEPTAGLDVISKLRIMSFLSELNSTVVCILHTDKFDHLFDEIIHLHSYN